VTIAGAAACAYNATVAVDDDPLRAIAGLKARLAAVRELCESRQAADGAGGPVDVDSLWPSEVLAVLDQKE
jgi:hypothetical protein